METFGLTKREFEVAQLIATNHSKKMVAEQLGIACGTVDRFTKIIYNKLKINTAIELTWWYIANTQQISIPQSVKIFQKAVVWLILIMISYSELTMQTSYERAFRTRSNRRIEISSRKKES